MLVLVLVLVLWQRDGVLGRQKQKLAKEAETLRVRYYYLAGGDTR